MYHCNPRTSPNHIRSQSCSTVSPCPCWRHRHISSKEVYWCVPHRPARVGWLRWHNKSRTAMSTSEAWNHQDYTCHQREHLVHWDNIRADPYHSSVTDWTEMSLGFSSDDSDQTRSQRTNQVHCDNTWAVDSWHSISKGVDVYYNQTRSYLHVTRGC